MNQSQAWEELLLRQRVDLDEDRCQCTGLLVKQYAPGSLSEFAEESSSLRNHSGKRFLATFDINLQNCKDLEYLWNPYLDITHGKVFFIRT